MFSPEWESFLGDPNDIDGCRCLESKENVSSKKKAESPNNDSLKKKTDILIPVVAATAVGEIVGFGFTALTFAGLGQRLNRAEAILQVYTSINPLQSIVAYAESHSTLRQLPYRFALDR